MGDEKSANDDHSCCTPKGADMQEEGKKTGAIAFGVGIGAAILATLCCAGPLIAVVLGVSGAVALAGLGKYHVYFMTAAALILIGGGVFIWRRQKECAVPGQKTNILKPLIISFAVFGLFTLGINQVLVPYLSQSKNSQSLAATPTGVELQQAIFAIEGMTCEGCAGTIGTVLSKALGVQKASVSFDKKQALVVYDPAKTNPEKLIAEIAKTDYKANLVNKAPFTKK